MPDLLEKVTSLAKRRGFIFPSSEIYGGFRSAYDYGPQGAALKWNLKREWIQEMVVKRADIVGLDAAILMSPKVWEASGHTTAGFADELAECPQCHKRWRYDHVKGACPDDKAKLGAPKKFNLLVRTFLGPVEDESALTYFRPETAQGIYVNFENVTATQRVKLPFGIAQIGKAFRNEITPGPFTYRMREFEQMEMQWFCKPDSADEWFTYWKQERMHWYVEVLGISPAHRRFPPHAKEELAHYAKTAVDIEYEYPWGWVELEGIHNRGDFDLTNHAKCSGKDISYFDEAINERVIPYIIETSGGVDRAILVLLLEHYKEEEVKSEKRVVLRFPRWLAPLPAAVLPIVKNNNLVVAKAHEVEQVLRAADFQVFYDEVGSIGRRYRRLDEIGTPFAITIDFDTLEQNTVTVRDRDSMQQERIAIPNLVSYIHEQLRKPI